MDGDKKTLAELSGEVKEKKYVTLDTGSKISGYTKDYLDRLCRLNKIEHRLWVKGGFVVELGSLIRETHTLLISDDEISFVHKRELVEQPGEDATTPSSATQTLAVERPAAEVAVPISAEGGSASGGEGMSQESQTGSAQSTGNVGIGTPPAAFIPPTQPEPLHQPAVTGMQIPNGTAAATAHKMEVAATDSFPAKNTTLEPAEYPIAEPSGSSGLTFLTKSAPSSVFTPPSPTQKVSPPPSSQGLLPAHDKWDALLFGGASGTNEEPDKPPKVVPPSTSLDRILSAHHPIQTSVDPSQHHDTAPLFPFSSEKATEEESALRKSVVSHLPLPSPISRDTPQISSAVPDRIVTLPPQLADEPAETFPKVCAGEHHLSVFSPNSLVKNFTPSAIVAFFIVSSMAVFFSMLLGSLLFPQIGTITYESDYRIKSPGAE